MVILMLKVNNGSSKFVNGLRQTVKPFLSIAEDKNGNEVILEYVLGFSITGHEKIIKWKARARDYPMLITFLRALELLERMEKVDNGFIEPCWHFCRAGAENNTFCRKKVIPLEEGLGPDGFQKLINIRDEIVSYVPTPNEYETLISKIRQSGLSDQSKELLTLLCREGREFSDDI